jgi:hypothetical protein
VVAERPAVTVDVAPGWWLMASGAKRDRSGRLGVDLLLDACPDPTRVAGEIVYAHRVAINDADAVDAWAAKATSEGRPSAAEIALTITAGILPAVLADLQEGDEKGPTQADRIVASVTSITAPPVGAADLAGGVAGVAELFHDESGEPYATIPVNGHRETWPLGSKGFKRWLAKRYFDAEGKAPTASALADAVALLSGKAQFEGPTRGVAVRLAEHDGKVYLDLADDDWRAVEIDRAGWRVVSDPPVRFRRPRGMEALPEPVAGGTVGDLRPFVNVASDDDWRLVVAWLVAAFRPTGPFPILVVHGEAGSAKSTLGRVLRALVDPNVAAIRSAPENERDIVIAASNGWTLVYDNASRLSDVLSDSLCRLATGGGFGTRELYSDDSEKLFNSTRPIVLNGIEELGTRGDFLDRAIIVYLPFIEPARRRREKTFWRAFDRDKPKLLGALLTAVATALKNETDDDAAEASRMADFEAWVVAAEPALGWMPGAFLTAYRANREAANDLALDGSLVSQVVRAWMEARTEPWQGTATDLVKALNERADEATKRQKSWPANGRSLSNALRRLGPNLRVAGIAIAFDRRTHGGKRTIKIERVGNPASPSSPKAERPSGGADFHGDARVTHAATGDANPVTQEKDGDGAVTQDALFALPLKTAPDQGFLPNGDGGDARFPVSSNGRVAHDDDCLGGLVDDDLLDGLAGTYPLATLLAMTAADLDDWQRACQAADDGDPFKKTDLALVAMARQTNAHGFVDDLAEETDDDLPV